MTKIALTPALLGSLALGVGATAINAAGQRKMRKQQDAANRDWMAFQDMKKADADRIEQAEREKAKIGLEESLAQQTGEAIDETIDTETDRLSAAFTEGLEGTADQMVAGAQAPGRDQVFDDAMAGSIAKATGEARERLAALARATAYGGGSMGGLGQSLNDANRDAAMTIGNANLFRNSATENLRRWQTVQPEMFEFKQSPLVPIMQGASMMLGMANPSGWWGKNLLSGAGAAAGNVASPVVAATQAGSGLAGGGGTGGGGFFAPARLNSAGGYSFLPANAGGFV